MTDPFEGNESEGFGEESWDGDEGDFEADLSKATDSAGIPKGKYAMHCTSVQRSVSESSGNKMFVWDFEVTAGDYMGKGFKVYTALTQAALWKLAEVTTALGIGEKGKPVKFTRDDVLGKSVMGIVEMSNYQGRKIPKLGAVEAHPDGPEYATENGLVGGF